MGQGLLFWGLRSHTPTRIHMTPKIPWDPYGTLWESEIFWTLHAGHLGRYIGTTWDPTEGRLGTPGRVHVLR